MKNTAEKLVELMKRVAEYDDNFGFIAARAFAKHLWIIAEKATELETLGFTLKIDVNPVRRGHGIVTLNYNGSDIRLYSVYYDGFSNGFRDVWQQKLEHDLDLILTVARMFTI